MLALNRMDIYRRWGALDGEIGQIDMYVATFLNILHFCLKIHKLVEDIHFSVLKATILFKGPLKRLFLYKSTP